MANDKMIEYKDNVFTKFKNFFKKLFNIGKKNNLTNLNKSNDEDNLENINPKFSDNNIFLESIKIKEDEEVERLKKLKYLYDKGEIEEEDLSEEDIEKIICLYNEETEKLEKDTLYRKEHIKQMLSEMKLIQEN